MIAQTIQIERNFESPEVKFWSWDVQSNHMHFSSALLPEMPADTGVTPAFTLESFALTILPADQEFVKDRFQKALWNGRSLKIEFRMKSNGDLIRYIYLEAQVIRNSIGFPSQLIGMAIDVTDREIPLRKTPVGHCCQSEGIKTSPSSSFANCFCSLD